VVVVVVVVVVMLLSLTMTCVGKSIEEMNVRRSENMSSKLCVVVVVV